MKYLALAMLLAVMQTPPPVPRKAANTNTGKGQNVAKYAEGDKKPAKPTPPFFQPIQSQPSQDAGGTQSADDDGKAIRVVKLPSVSVARDRIDYIGLALSAVLLFVGVCGIWAAYRTLKAIESQVNLQKIQMRQWVDIGGWDAVFSERNGIPSMPSLGVTFEVTNPTNFPLTVLVLANINRMTFHQSGTTFLSPGRPYTVSQSISLNSEEVAHYEEDRLLVPIKGTVSYSDIEGAKIQSFGGHLFCRRGTRTVFRPDIPMTPQQKS